jgi:uncharacterized repeat protein (TIGR01451 family)
VYRSSKRPICLWVLLVLALLGVFPPTAAAQSETPPPPADRPLIFIRSSWVEPSVVAPGQLCRLYLELHNVGDVSATNIVVSIAGTNFVPELSSSVKTVESLQPDEHATVWQDLRAVPNVETGAYPVTVQITYTGDDGYDYSGAETVGIKVLAPTPTVKPQAGRPQIVIEAFSAQPQPIPGGTFTLTLTLHNSGTGAARNVLLTHGVPSSFAAVGTGSVTSVGGIGWQQTVGVEIPMLVDGAAKAGTNLHPITLDYDNAAGEHVQSVQNLAVQVGQGGAKPGPQEPLVVIESYTNDPETLTPGQAFTLTLRILNVAATDAQRVMLTFGQQVDASKSAPVAPLGTGNVRYLPKLAAGAQAEVAGRFIVDGTADAGVYVLTVGIEFSGTGDKPITRNEQISLVVRVVPQLLFNFYRPVPTALVGQPIDLPIEILNAGRTMVASNEVEVVSTELNVETPKVYIGPLDRGASVTMDARATADSPGEKHLTIRVHYIDDFNQPQVFEGERTIMVEAAPEAGGPGGTPGPGGQPGSEGEPPAEQEQRPWLIRLLRGLFGLGSS